MRILVTGGSGFLGYALCKRLIEDGNEVISLDKIPSKICTFMLHDIIDPLPKIKVDEIYNLASTPSPVKYIANQIHTSKTNILGVYNVLELAESCRAKVLQVSTCEVYEEEDPRSERACYRLSKKMAESIFYDYHRCYDLDIRIARLHNVYGPGMQLDDGRVIPEFARRAFNNEDIVLLGNNARSFCYIDDMVDGLIKLMNSNYTAPMDLFNRELVTIEEIANYIIRMSGSKSKIIRKEQRGDDSKQVLPKENKALEILGWKPTIPFEDGIEKTMKYFWGEICGRKN